MWELVGSIRALQDPSTAALHLPWVVELRRRLPELDLAELVALAPSRGYVPDFLSPPPTTPLATFEDELELVRATPADQVRREVEARMRTGGRPARLRPFLDRPRRSVARLAATLEAYWRAAIEPHWPRLRALLEADVGHRARRLAEGGPAALFAELHTTVRWRESVLTVDQAYDATVPLRGEGLLLVPSAFSWDRPATITDPPWQPTLVYPARGVGTLWEEGEAAPDALAGVLGATRAALLSALDAPRSTTDLARLLGLSPGGASQHLTALRAAGLVTARREGRSVLYARTALGDGLVRG